MTVQTNTNVASFNGNGVTQIFPIAFKFNNDTDLVVLLVDDAAGTSIRLTLNSDYTVSGEGDEQGGLINVVTAPATGKRLLVSRVVDILQLLDLRNQGKFFAEVHEDAFDLLTMIAQQHDSGIKASIRVAESDPEPTRLPSAAQRAGKILGFSDNGDPIVVIPVTDSAAALRLELANGGGAGMLGYGSSEAYSGGTVGAALQALTAEIDELSYISPGSALSLSDVMSKTVTGGSLVINAFGDSMTYGQDTTSTTGDLLPGMNGSSATRALYQYPEALGAALTKAGFSVTVNNYGFPGDTAVQGLTRFPSAVSSDISIIMFGHNDAVDVSGSPRTSPADFKTAMSGIIKRELAKGSFPVLLTPPRIKQSNFTGANLNRQLWMRVFESIIAQLGQQFAIPVVSADELVGHRGGEIYSDDVHFNKYGYNELGWNLSALFIQRSSEPKRISNGTVIQAAGSSITGGQSLIGTQTVLRAQPTVPLCISGYFDDGLVARVHIVYNTGVGGTQRGKVTLGGGLRNGPTSQAKVAVVSAAPGRILNSDVIPAGYRTLFFETAGSTTNVYVEKIEFVRSGELLNDSAGIYGKASALEGVSLALNAGEATRFIIDDSNPLIGDFTLDAELSADPGAADSAGIALVSEYDEATGLPSRYILVTRRGDTSDFVFVRLATSSNTDTTYTTPAFPSAATSLKIVRSGDSFSVYAQGTLLTTLTYAFGRLNPALYRERAAVTASRVTIKR